MLGPGQLGVQVDHRQDQVPAGAGEPAAQLPAGVTAGLDQHARVPERGVRLHPSRQGPLVLVAVLDHGGREIEVCGGRLGKVDEQEVHAREVAPLAIPARMPGDPEDGEVAPLHVLEAGPDPAAVDHEQVRIEHQGVACRHSPDGQVQGRGVMVAAAAGQRQGLRIDPRDHFAPRIVDLELRRSLRRVVDHQKAEGGAGTERIDHLQLAADVAVVLLDSDGQDGELGLAGHQPRASFGGGPSSAGSNSNAQTSVQTIEIIRILPMLAVPGWLESQRLPKATPVVRALNSTARARLDCSRLVSPERQASTK